MHTCVNHQTPCIVVVICPFSPSVDTETHHSLVAGMVLSSPCLPSITCYQHRPTLHTHHNRRTKSLTSAFNHTRSWSSFLTMVGRKNTARAISPCEGLKAVCSRAASAVEDSSGAVQCHPPCEEPHGRGSCMSQTFSPLCCPHLVCRHEQRLVMTLSPWMVSIYGRPLALDPPLPVRQCWSTLALGVGAARHRQSAWVITSCFSTRKRATVHPTLKGDCVR